MELVFIKIFRLLKLVIILIIVKSNTIYSQTVLKPFSYNILGKQNIIIGLAEISKTVKKLVYVKGNENPINELKIFHYHKPLPFQVYCYAELSMGQAYRPYVLINKHKFIFDDIIGNSPENSIQTCGITPYYFSLNKRNFLLYQIVACFNGNYCDYLFILFDITQPKKPKITLSIYDASISPECFGDFNRDGYLDFAHRNNGGTKLECYSLYEDKFKKLDNIELILTGREGNLQIDLSKSKWFFDLDKK